jgi:hypothetical protein
VEKQYTWANTMLTGSLIVALALVTAPRAAADVAPSVRTQSGKVRCYVATDFRGQPGPDVICQTQTGNGFPQAPTDSGGLHWNQAIVDAGGAFQWYNANIPASEQALARDTILEYGQTYHLQGWTIEAASDGTRFTNDGTTHGMFVSVENVYSF